MPRSFIETEPNYINKVTAGNKPQNITKRVVEIATTNRNKLTEFQRLMPDIEVVGVKLDVDEVQSLDPFYVAKQKAKAAFEKNGFNPVLVEDTSFDIFGLGGRPGTYLAHFLADMELRKLIVKKWVGEDRRALARVILAIHDGKETYLFEGLTEGLVADKPKGSLGFVFDDIFIPKGDTRTFAEMGPENKDKYSMRRKAVEAFLKADLKLGSYIEELPEPFENELKRVRKEKLNNSKSALKFAYSLEALQGSQLNKDFEASKYKPVAKEETTFYDRYLLNSLSHSMGLILTDIDKSHIQLHKNGQPKLWQMGPERRMLALAQRAEYFINNTDPKILKTIESLEKKNAFIKRPNKRSPSLETIMKYDFMSIPFNTIAVKELGYKKLPAKKTVSRRYISQYGLFNKIGKYPRLMYGVGSMPAVSGWRDTIITTIIGHMAIFITRNNIFAENEDLRVQLINDAKNVLNSVGLPKKQLPLYERNIGAAIGTANPKAEVLRVKRLIDEAGVRLFRIYTINSDPRFVETAALLRKEYGHEIEIFAGQVVDKTQVYKLRDVAEIDGVIIGHGGGRQCTSATNGMALTTVEELYSLVTDHNFNDITVMVEGGVGRSVGALVVLGVDGILYNQQFTRGTIETGGIFVQNKNGDFGQPYHGSASAPTMIIEAASEDLLDQRLSYSGRTKVPEGKKGFTVYSEKANSMSFWIEEFKHQLARTMADLGVENINELRNFIAGYDKELLRIVSTEAAQTAQAYKNKASK